MEWAPGHGHSRVIGPWVDQSGTVTFPANSCCRSSTQTITIAITDDKLSEVAEGFTVTLGTITSTLSSQISLKNGSSSCDWRPSAEPVTPSRSP